MNYVGGGSATFTQSFSDWMNGYTGTGGTTAPGESIAVTMTSYNTATGNTSGQVYLYGYVFSTSTAHAIASIQLPNDSKIKILAIDEVLAPSHSVSEAGVIKGKAVAAGSQPLPGNVMTGTSPSLATARLLRFRRHPAPTWFRRHSTKCIRLHGRHHSKKQPRQKVHSAADQIDKEVAGRSAP